MNEQLNISDLTRPPVKINKTIRLIELFAGVGAQRMALRDLGAKYESHVIYEWNIHSIASYKAIHCSDDNTDYSIGRSREELIHTLHSMGISSDDKSPMKLETIRKKPEAWLRTVYNNIISTKNLVDITKAKGGDLNITNKHLYTYLLTYSFPCQALSVAGKMKGMDKGSGTSSGLLWEVERLLDESEEIPDVLIMENVPGVCGKKNMENFIMWQDFLVSKGYISYTQILNANNYGVAQSRNRCFMVSVLGNYNYQFPAPIPLKWSVLDYLEDNVGEEYYIETPKAKELIAELLKGGKLENIQDRAYVDLTVDNPNIKPVANCIMARDRGISRIKSMGGGVIEQN